ncbi:MAG: hypothetical protein JXB48_17730 [Candidatus Latescibacteria bacterium]|nr:hypothetical protein [Candidatus Latescibacterota bacterium]
MGREIISLNGPWEIQFDHDNSGKEKGLLTDESITFGRTTDVPSTWNCIEPEYEGVAFYRKRFTVQPEFKDKKIRLRFGAVNYFAEVSLNGMVIGAHEGGYTPFEFDITGSVRFDTENILTVRVVDPPNDGSGRAIDGIRHMEIPSGKESWYVNFSGIWQNVELVVTNRTYIEDMIVIPNIEKNSVRVRLTVQSDTVGNGEIVFCVSDLTDSQILVSDQRITCIDEGHNLMIADLPLENFDYWEPDNPVLYKLTVTLKIDDSFIDSLSERFGMRGFELKDNFFHLNGRKIILKGLLHQQQYPKNLAYPASRAEARRIVRLLKDGGWNIIRIHIRPTTPEFLEVCDEEGMLIFEEPAIGWIVDSEKLEERTLTEVRDMVKRDRNHPSVVMWGILNESGVRGAPDILGRTKMYWNKSDMGVQRLKPKLARAIRELDGSRIISDDSGAVTCNYYPPESFEPVNYYDNHLYMSYPLSHAGFEVFRNLGKPEDFFRSHQFENFEINHRIGGGSPEKLYMQSEFGCGGVPLWPEVLKYYDSEPGIMYRDETVYRRIDGILRDYYDRELTGVFDSYEDALIETQKVQAISARRMIEALRANKLCAGYVFTQLHDNDYECNAGILDPLFRPKRVYEAAQEANRPLRVALETWERTVFPGGTFNIAVTVINDAGFNGELTLALTTTNPAGDVIKEEKIPFEAQDGVQDVHTFEITTGNKEGSYSTRAELYDGENLLDSAEYTNYVIPPVGDPVELKSINLISFKGKVRSWFDTHGIPSDSADPDLYIIEPTDKKQINDARIANVLKKVKENGADVLFLGLPLICLSDADEELQELRDSGKYVCWCSPTEFESDVFDFDIPYYDSKPRFVGPYHYFKKHPVFESLVPGHVLDDRFAGIMPLTSVRIEGAVTIGGSFGTPIGYHFKIRGCEHARDPRYGTDLAIVPYGKGRLIISTYRIAENLGKDPVADRLLWNMLKKDVL